MWYSQSCSHTATSPSAFASDITVVGKIQLLRGKQLVFTGNEK
jgi:hypothetical protein